MLKIREILGLSKENQKIRFQNIVDAADKEIAVILKKYNLAQIGQLHISPEGILPLIAYRDISKLKKNEKSQEQNQSL